MKAHVTCNTCLCALQHPYCVSDTLIRTRTYDHISDVLGRLCQLTCGVKMILSRLSMFVNSVISYSGNLINHTFVCDHMQAVKPHQTLLQTLLLASL